MSAFLRVLDRVPRVLDLILSFGVTKFRDIYYRYGMINHLFKDLLHGPKGHSLVNEIGYQCLNHIISEEFMLPPEALFLIMSETGASICGGLALLGVMFRKKTFDGDSDMDLFAPRPTETELLCPVFKSAADRIGEFLLGCNYELENTYKLDPHHSDICEGVDFRYGKICAAYLYEIRTYGALHRNKSGKLKSVQIITLRENGRQSQSVINYFDLTVCQVSMTVRKSCGFSPFVAKFAMKNPFDICYKLVVINCLFKENMYKIRRSLSIVQNFSPKSQDILCRKLHTRILKYRNRGFRLCIADSVFCLIIADLFNFLNICDECME